jgi:hypothetical protein
MTPYEQGYRVFLKVAGLGSTAEKLDIPRALGNLVGAPNAQLASKLNVNAPAARELAPSWADIGRVEDFVNTNNSLAGLSDADRALWGSHGVW